MKKEKKNGFKINKTLKTLFIICSLIIGIELLSILIMYIYNERKINYLDTVNNIKSYNKEYLEIGSSNYRYSKYNKVKTYKYYGKENQATGDYQKIVSEQAKLVKYDKEMKIIWEKTFDSKYDSSFYDGIKVKDGYIAVGSYIYDYKQINLKTRDGLIVKYDNNGNMKWFKNYQVLGDTEFYKVIDVNDGLIVIGQSIYENMEIGNHDMGGGIIVKYDYNGNIVWKNNHGGNKSGSFNDIIQVKDGYIVCGKDGSNYGMLAKFNFNGKKIWANSTLNVAKTDKYGFNNMMMYDNKLYIASSVNNSSLKNSKGEPIYSFDACVYVYDLNGKYITKYIYGGNKDDRFNDLYVDKTGILAVGYTLSDNIFKKDQIAKQTGMAIKFNFNKKVLLEKSYGGKNYDVLTTVILDNDNYLIGGYSNSFGNKKDFNVVYYNIKHS